MSEDDVLFGYRSQLFDLAARTTVSEACRVFGIHRSTYYGWKRRVERHGLEILRPRERRAAEAAQPALAAGGRSGSSLSRSATPAWARSGSRLSCARSAGEACSSRTTASGAAWAATASARAPSGWRSLPATPPPTSRRVRLRERHVEAERPGELVGMDCFYVGRLAGTKGPVWQLTAIDVASSFAWAELVTCARGNPTGEQTSKLACRVARELQSGRLATRARPHGQRRRVSRPLLPGHARPARRPPHADPRRPPADQRRRRSAAPDDP